VSIEHTDVAAYSLGLLDQKDRQNFESHLAQCEECLAELGEFSAMADLFAGIGPVRVDDEEPDATAVVDFVARRAVAQRKQTRQRTWLAVAASVVLLAGGVAVGLGLAPQKAPPPVGLRLTGQEHSARNPTSGIDGVVGLVTKSWGTQVTLELTRLKVTKPLKCQLIAVSKAGQRRVMVGWLVPVPGYGVRGHPAPLLLIGGTWLVKKDLSEIQIQVFHGPTLLTIPI
jgi:hypothetical protein